MFSFLFNRTPSKAKFAQLVLKELQKANAEPHEYDEHEFCLRTGAGQLNLSNVYAEYCEAKGEQRKLILANIASVPSQEEADAIDREEALEMAIAVIRERALFSNAGSEIPVVLNRSPTGTHVWLFSICLAPCKWLATRA